MASSRNLFVMGLCEKSALNFTVGGPVTVSDFKELFFHRMPVNWSFFSLSHGGVILDDSDVIGECNVTVLHAHPLLKGGKGGFGSLIRAMGSQINKSTNKEACRNLSGRRVRDVNAEKKLAKWAAEEPERKRKEAEEKRQRLERKRAGPKHTFDDTCYMEQIKSTEEGMDGALKQGLEASSSGNGKGKRKAVDTDKPCKKPKLWLGVDEDLTDSENEDVHTDQLDQVSPSQPLMSTVLNTTSNNPDEAVPCCSSAMLKIASDGNPGDAVTSCSSNSASSSPSPAGECSKTEKKVMAGDDGEEQPPQSSQLDIGHEPIDLNAYDSAEGLVLVGGERLKVALQELGLKCGGTPSERAIRLFSTKGKTREQFDPSLFAKSKKTNSKRTIP